MTEFKDCRLEDCLAVLIDYRGKSPKKSTSGIPVISAKVVKDGRILSPIEQTIDTAYYVEWMRRGNPRVGDVVLTTEGPLGEVAQLDSETAKYALGQRIVVLRGKEDVLDNTFLKFLLMSPSGQERLKAFATGTTVEGISQKALRQVSLSVPKIETQKHIANLLGSLDDKIELNRRMNETLEAMAQAIFRDWFVDFGPTRRKLEGVTDPLTIMGGLVQDAERAQALADLFPAALGDDGLPEGWRTTTVSTVCSSAENGGTPKRSEPAYWDGGTVPWLTSGEVRSPIILDAETKITELGLRSSSAKLWPMNTTVIAMYGATAGQTCILASPVSTNQACCGLLPKAGCDLFLYHTMREHMSKLANLAVGAAQQNLSQRTIANFEITKPSLEAMTCFGETTKPFLERRVAAERENRTLAATRDLLLPKLMSGKIRLSEAEDLMEAAQ
jgi:type I restriction enzyme, S subunit